MNRANRPPRAVTPRMVPYGPGVLSRNAGIGQRYPTAPEPPSMLTPYRDGCGHATPIRPSPRTSKLLRLSWAYLTMIPKHGSSPAPLAALAFYVKRCRARYGQFCAVLLLPHTCPDCQIIRPPGLHYSAGGGLRP